jgi:hypothetical protein
MIWVLWILGFVTALIPAFWGVYNGATVLGIIVFGFATVALIRKADNNV